MRYFQTHGTDLEVPELALGVMRLPELQQAEADKLINASLDLGINMFDTADIYHQGESDIVLAKAIKHHKREDLIIQTKASIIPGVMYDASKEHLVASLNASLDRLGTDYVDIFLLHRPDALIEAEEVAEAFAELYDAGKVRHFGVSNFSSHQMELLNSYLPEHLKAKFNQIQFGIGHSKFIDNGLNINRNVPQNNDPAGGLLEYAQLKKINLQAWSPMQSSDSNSVFIDNPRYPELNQVMQEVADTHNTNKTAIAVAWILRHPAKIQTILGTTKTHRLEDSAEATNFTLSREEWYKIYMAAGKRLP